MTLFYHPELSEGNYTLEGDEAHHAKVLRLSVGSEIMVTDGKGTMANCSISAIEKTSIVFSIIKTSSTPSPTPIHLYVAPTKNADRIEWLVEKATEIGIASITMMKCERNERKSINHDRLIKMAVSAMKQSQQSWLPEIKDLTPFKEIISLKYEQKFIAYVDHSNPDQLKNLAKPGGSYGLMIGPEGDFTSDEIELAVKNCWIKVGLGPTRLRTETAALAGCFTLALANQ